MKEMRYCADRSTALIKEKIKEGFGALSYKIGDIPSFLKEIDLPNDSFFKRALFEPIKSKEGNRWALKSDRGDNTFYLKAITHALSQYRERIARYQRNYDHKRKDKLEIKPSVDLSMEEKIQNKLKELNDQISQLNAKRDELKAALDAINTLKHFEL